MNSAAAEFFPHIRIVMGMVIGLGITRILMGIAVLIQHPQHRPKLSAIHLLWALSILGELILFWWWEFELFALKDWSFGVFAFLIGYAITLFMLCALLFPDKIEEYDGYEDFFLKRRHWFFGIFALTFALDVIDSLIKGSPYFDNLGIGYLIQVPMGIVLCLIAIRTTDRRYHLGLVLVHLAYQAAWIGQLFTIDI
jgi:MFS superfamily sulfate permease-like transporter